MKNDYNKMREDIANFIHESMCVDGFVKFDSPVDEVKRHGKKLDGMLFEVTDKKRGKFYIAWFTEKEAKIISSNPPVMGSKPKRKKKEPFMTAEKFSEMCDVIKRI